jgi:hypothetical protein
MQITITKVPLQNGAIRDKFDAWFFFKNNQNEKKLKILGAYSSEISDFRI